MSSFAAVGGPALYAEHNWQFDGVSSLSKLIEVKASEAQRRAREVGLEGDAEQSVCR